MELQTSKLAPSIWYRCGRVSGGTSNASRGIDFVREWCSNYWRKDESLAGDVQQRKGTDRGWVGRTELQPLARSALVDTRTTPDSRSGRLVVDARRKRGLAGLGGCQCRGRRRIGQAGSTIN
ncbi:uncharacterized protein HMPREF1120_03647 [Exophiala dermatitidis NIH/UT8656]|uniref:Uncharacterized protein n=1 Tax=Exophiala dermatitidis (strain ATCC 34100 / CBS 525.76 / NIH/UT8656) TaxID=858893 RepID=H6BTT7_EXODN|nr:uncharacterized protein HMPREF1120_03647 [Exophiala dermatitidis NIH/UT8656]EHY55514.1 hypothetical protein HMPREF1120_03647 [Exophiala dermatitidis NIH/UT8656]